MAGIETPWIVADDTAAGLTSQLVEVWGVLAQIGHGMSDSEWEQATPCPGWPVAAQYAHIIGTESMLLGRPNPDVDPGEQDHVRNDIGAFNEKWIAALAGQPRADVLAQFAEVTAERRETLMAMGEEEFSQPSWTPIGQADYRRFMQIRVFDCWVHEQDIRDGLTDPGHEDGPVAEQAVDEIARAVGYLVGKKGKAPDGSSVLISLTGPVTRDLAVSVVEGRARPVASLEGAATATISLSSTAFTRLACGRIDPSAVLEGALGGVTFAGDEELGRRVATNLAFTI